MSVTDESKVLIIDDDPSHLEIYSHIVRHARMSPVTSLVTFKGGVDLPATEPIRLVLLDYRLHSSITSTEIAQRAGLLYPDAPIILLSDVFGMPEDIAPYVTEFVRKGEPAMLVAAMSRLLLQAQTDAMASTQKV